MITCQLPATLLTLLTLLAAASVPGAQVITEMTPAAIAEAIKEGTTSGSVRFYPARGGAFDIGANIGVAYSTPHVRIAFAANQAKKRLQAIHRG